VDWAKFTSINTKLFQANLSLHHIPSPPQSPHQHETSTTGRAHAVPKMAAKATMGSAGPEGGTKGLH